MPALRSSALRTGEHAAAFARRLNQEAAADAVGAVVVVRKGISERPCRDLLRRRPGRATAGDEAP